MLGIDYAIRFRDVILVTDSEGNQGYAKGYLLPNGRPRMLSTPRVNDKKIPVPAVVVTKAKKMQEPWCIATSLTKKTAADVVTLYGAAFHDRRSVPRHQRPYNWGWGCRPSTSATQTDATERRCWSRLRRLSFPHSVKQAKTQDSTSR